MPQINWGSYAMAKKSKTDPAEIPDIRVEMTLVEGTIVYRNEG